MYVFRSVGLFDICLAKYYKPKTRVVQAALQ